MHLRSAHLMFNRASYLSRPRYEYDDEPLAVKLRRMLRERTGEPTADTWLFRPENAPSLR